MPPSKREELIDAAMRVFYTHGFQSTCIDKVLQEGGISRMTLYNHFKSKEDLIVAALKRRDEQFRTAMVRAVDAAPGTPRDKILATFDHIAEWISGDQFCGCMFINAAAEYGDKDCAVRRLAADHKQDIITYLSRLCRDADVADPDKAGEQLALLIEGAIVTAQVVAQAQDECMRHSIGLAKEMAAKIVDEGRAAAA